jgi:hypothetical protein
VRARRDEQLVGEIAGVYRENYVAYGARRSLGDRRTG